MQVRYSRLKLISVTGGLLGACLIILFGLAWQAVQATRAHYAISENILREYAVLILNEYSRRITQDVGYRGYFETISEIRERYQESYVADLTLTSKNADLVSHTVLFKENVLSVFKVDESGPSKNITRLLDQALLTSLSELDKRSLDRRPFHALHLIGAAPQTLIFTLLNDDVVGFIVDKEALKKQFANSFARAPLFPQSLANGKLTNDFIGISVSLVDGSQFDQYGFNNHVPLVSKVMQDEYGGIFKGMTIGVSINPAITRDLIMGDRPILRLPLILIAFVVAAGLLLIAIQQMRRERALIGMRNRFIAEASHELRTPLTQIRLFAETLMLDRAKDEAAKNKALSIINREAQRLGYLVDNILSFSQKASRRKITLEEENIGDIVVDAADELELMAAQLGCTFNLEIHDVSCLIDRGALYQILINLFDNALKYGGKNQLITVRVRKTSDAAVIYVIDQGAGVPEEERDKIWRDFYRPDTHNETGVGIGLSIVRELAKQMKGECYLEPMELGACFVLSFPLMDGLIHQGAVEAAQ